MTEERWEALVHRLEEVAAEKPRAYRVRVALLAGLGYGYVFGVLALLTVGVAAVVVIAFTTAAALVKFAIPLAGIALIVLRSLWVRIPAPEGYELPRDRARGLWEQVDTLRRSLKAPRVHKVLMDDELNAGVVQVPRFGLFGPQRNYLIVGLPLMQALSPAEFNAVLAHEFGHLSGNHSRFAGWIYRLRRTWANLLTSLEERRGAGIALFRRFFEWYSPYFGAYTFALARQDEYVADGVAREAAGERAAAGALVRISATARFLHTRHWPNVFERVAAEPEPPRAAFSGLRERLPLRETADAREWVDEELTEASDLADTHPSLRDRLDGLGYPVEQVPALLEPPDRTAAQALLGDFEGELAEQFDEQWREEVAPTWRERHEEQREARERYEELRGLAAPDYDERIELARLTYDFDGAEAAAPLYRTLAAERPDDAVALYGLGLSLLTLGDDGGLAPLDRAMEVDEEAVLPGCRLAYEYLMERGREQEAEPYAQRGQARIELLEAADAERVDVEVGDPLAPHGLGEDVLAGVRRVLDEERAVRRGYLARKVLEHFPDEAPVFLLAVEVRRFARNRDPQKLVERLVDRIELPGRVIVVTLAGPYKKFRGALRDVAESRVYG